MSALTAEFMCTFERITRKEFPLGYGVKAYKGATAFGRPSTGFVYPAKPGAGAAGANDIMLGVFHETIDNTAGTATTLPVTVDFIREKTLLWRANDPGAGAIVATDRFNPCYALDDQTASKTTTNAAKLGTIVDVDSVLGVAFELGGI